jgi:hypothetical protein
MKHTPCAAQLVRRPPACPWLPEAAVRGGPPCAQGACMHAAAVNGFDSWLTQAEEGQKRRMRADYVAERGTVCSKYV